MLEISTRSKTKAFYLFEIKLKRVVAYERAPFHLEFCISISTQTGIRWKIENILKCLLLIGRVGRTVWLLNNEDILLNVTVIL